MRSNLSMELVHGIKKTWQIQLILLVPFEMHGALRDDTKQLQVNNKGI